MDWASTADSGNAMDGSYNPFLEAGGSANARASLPHGARHVAAEPDLAFGIVEKHGQMVGFGTVRTVRHNRGQGTGADEGIQFLHARFREMPRIVHGFQYAMRT